MKILIIGDHFYPEEFIINDLAKEWSNRGHEITVLTQNPAYPKGKVFEGYKNRIFQVTYWNNIAIHRVYTVQEYKRSLNRKILNYLSFPILGTITAIRIARKFDRIFVSQMGPLTQAIPAIIAHKLYKVKVAIWTGDIWPDTVYAYGFKKSKVLSFLLDKLVKSIYRNCDSVFIQSPGFEKALRKYTPGKKLIVAHFWSTNNPGTGTANGFMLSNNKNFTFAGNIGKVQNLLNVVLGFEKALRINAGITLNFIGDGSYLTDLQNEVKNRNIPNIIFWGRQPANEMDKYYKASDFLIISLDPDPVYDLYIPGKFQTYLQTGKPILSIMKGEVPELVEKYDIGVVASPDNIEDIAGKFIQCTLLSQEKLENIKVNSNNLLESNFDRMKIIDVISQELFDKPKSIT